MANDDIPEDLMQSIAKARGAGSRPYIRYGEYVLMLERVFYQKIQDRCLIWDFRVQEAKKVRVYEGSRLIETEPNEIGSPCGTTINYDGKGKLSAPANTAAIVIAFSGQPAEKVTDDQVRETLTHLKSAANPGRGALIRCVASPKVVRDKKHLPDETPGKFITGLEWHCVAPIGEGANSLAEIAKRRAELDAIADEDPSSVSTASATPPPVATATAPPPPAPSSQFPLDGWAPHPNTAGYFYRENVVKPSQEFAQALGGWQPHPQTPGYFYKNQEVKSASDLAAILRR